MLFTASAARAALAADAGRAARVVLAAGAALAACAALSACGASVYHPIVGAPGGPDADTGGGPGPGAGADARPDGRGDAPDGIGPDGGGRREDGGPDAGRDGTAGGDQDAGPDAGPEPDGGPGWWPPLLEGETDAIFDPTRLDQVHIDFDVDQIVAEGYAREQWREWLRWEHWTECPPRDYVPATFTWERGDTGEREVLEYVGVRWRGQTWPRADEVEPGHGFKIHFHALLPEAGPGEEPRRFHDLNRLNLLSHEGDDTVFRQCLAYRVLNDFGVPAPRCNHVRVWVNDESYGVMQHAEEPDDRRYLRHRFVPEGWPGALYEVGFGCGFDHTDFDHDGDSYASYDAEWDLAAETTVEDFEAQVVPLLRCLDPTVTPDPDEFRACAREWINLDAMLRLVAVEMAAPLPETMSGAGREFYLYFLPEPDAPNGGRFLGWVWDLDAAFALDRGEYWQQRDQPWNILFDYRSFRRRQGWIPRRLIESFRDEYCDSVERFLVTAFSAARIDELIDGAIALLDEAMLDDPNVTHRRWLDDMEDRRAEIATRRAQVEEQLPTCRTDVRDADTL